MDIDHLLNGARARSDKRPAGPDGGLRAGAVSSGSGR